MWESPVNIYETISNMVVEEIDRNIFVEIKKQLGIDINKDELIKALQYDRNQYEKGYKDGYSVGYGDSCKENWVYNENPDENGRYLVAVQCENDKRIIIGKYLDGRWLLFENVNVIAWQTLPEVPEMR